MCQYNENHVVDIVSILCPDLSLTITVFSPNSDRSNEITGAVASTAAEHVASATATKSSMGALIGLGFLPGVYSNATKTHISKNRVRIAWIVFLALDRFLLSRFPEKTLCSFSRE
jgi:hypothetical protein